MQLLAVPVLGLVCGAAVGLWWPELPAAWLVAVLVGWTLLAVHAGRVAQPLLLAVSACGAFAVGGAALSAHAWHLAWRPPLRVLVESLAHAERAAAIRDGRQLPEDVSVPVVVSGVLASDASLSARGTVSLELEVEWAGALAGGNGWTDADSNPARGGVLLGVLGTLAPARMSEWRAGRRVRVVAELRRPARYLDPGVPDQERAMARRGVTLVGSVKSGALVTVLAPGAFAEEWAARARAFARRSIARGVGAWSPRASSIVTAIVIGDRTGLEPDVERRLQESGTYHVIAISGGNIALLAGLTLGVFRLAGVLGRTAMLSAASGLVAYGFIVGGGASVNRAVLMACVYLVGRAWDLRGPPLQSLLLAVGTLVLHDPLSVVDPAMLLTFGATAAIVLSAPVASVSDVVTTGGVERWLAPVVRMLMASVAVEVVLLPVAALFFYRVTFAGLVLNFGAVPLMAVAQFAGMAVVPLDAVWPAAARAAGWFAVVGAEGLVRTADAVQLAPWSTWRVPPPSVAVVVAYYGGLFTAWACWRRLRRVAADGRQGASGSARRARVALAQRGVPERGLMPAVSVSGLLVAIGAGLWMIAPSSQWFGPRGDGRLHVTFLDVGQGDAALVRFPLGSSMLIDAGGLPGASSFDMGERVVGPVLWRAGVNRLDLLALTHGDADHIGGAASVLRDFRPWDAWEGVPVPAHALLAALHRNSVAQRTRWTTIQRGDRTEIDGVQLFVQHPPVPDWERQDVRNDDSLVIELRWREVSFVFTGDVGVEAERTLAASFGPARLRVVKVPHHGSATSSSDGLVRGLSPDAAVISAGRGNRFGHPAPSVVERYLAAGVEVFRTDRDGAVSMATDGRSLDVRTHAGRWVRIHPRVRAPSADARR